MKPLNKIQIGSHYVEESNQIRNDNQRRDEINPRENTSEKITQILDKLVNAKENKSLKTQIEESKQMKDEEFNIFHENEVKQYFEITSINLDEEKENKEILYLIKNLNNFKKIQDLQNNENKLRIYFSSVSHDIRTLINIVQGKSEMIEAIEEDRDKKKLLKSIMNASSMLNLMVQEVLDFSQLRNGSLRVILVNFNLKDEFKSLIELFEEKYKAKGLFLNLEIDPSTPEIVRNDVNKVKQILLNLISNAFKFTSVGGVTIQVTGTIHNLIQVEVIDTGVGFDMTDKAKLFQEFGRLSMHSAINPNGVGLGLFICKQMAEKLSGSIDAYSELNKGTTFIFTFKNFFEDKEIFNEEVNPVNQEEEKFAFETNFEPMTSRKLFNSPPQDFDTKASQPFFCQPYLLNKEKICNCSQLLIVEDDIDLRIVLKNFSSRCDVKYEEAPNGEIAIDLVKTRLRNGCCKTFRLILTDFLMPIMDGLQSSIEIKKILNDIPDENSNIILVSALEESQQKKITQLDTNPFVDIVPKPLKFSDFKLIVNKYL